MGGTHRWILAVGLMLGGGCTAPTSPEAPVELSTAPPVAAHDVQPVTAGQVKRVSTAVPFPRGLQMVDGKLYVLARGRVRESGGASGEIDDKAGTIYVVDPTIAEPVSANEVSARVRGNGAVFAAPTAPPFRLFDRSATPATRDRETDRPYCGLRYDPVTANFYLCAFSGIDKPEGGKGNFSKNVADAVLRYDTRSKRWHEVERHSIEAGGNYPHQDPYSSAPPHGWLNGPDNCLVVGQWLYCVAKDNNLLVRYDLAEIARNPDAPAPPSQWVLDHKLTIEGDGLREFFGHSMLAEDGGFLYIGYRTSSAIVRIPLDRLGLPRQPIIGQIVARFAPYDPATRKSANLTDMVFDADGNLYVISAQPSRIYRFKPDPRNVFDARNDNAPPAWADMAALTNNPKMKSENVFVDTAGAVYVTSGDAYDFQYGSGGTVYRIDPR